ncbi:MAG: hypothetical protein H7174_03530 [Flavobacterium sp.]|nr:hypothetical protein [Flavobacterium sp.]
MFLNYIKEFSLKKILKNSFRIVNNNQNVTTIKSVGLLVDESNFNQTDKLISDLVNNGIRKDNINVIVYKDKLNQNEVFSHPTFNNKHINFSGKFTEKVVLNFIEKKFDLLISYYNIEKSSLMIITNNSKADFKVGFANIDKRLNQLTINTTIENHKIFTFELFKYLKILKKI